MNSENISREDAKGAKGPGAECITMPGVRAGAYWSMHRIFCAGQGRDREQRTERRAQQKGASDQTHNKNVMSNAAPAREVEKRTNLGNARAHSL